MATRIGLLVVPENIYQQKYDSHKVMDISCTPSYQILCYKAEFRAPHFANSFSSNTPVKSSWQNPLSQFNHARHNSLIDNFFKVYSGTPFLWNSGGMQTRSFSFNHVATTSWVLPNAIQSSQSEARSDPFTESFVRSTIIFVMINGGDHVFFRNQR